MTIEPRLRAVARKHRGSRAVVKDLSAKLSSLYANLTEAKKNQQAIDREIRWCVGHLDFQQREVVTQYEGQFRVYEIDDGETHTVAATSRCQALQFYAVDVSGYESVTAYKKDMPNVVVSDQIDDAVIAVHDVDDTGSLIVKTAAEWAETDKPYVVATTAY